MRDRVTQADVERVVRLLLHDLVETVGHGFEPVVLEAATNIYMFTDDPPDFDGVRDAVAEFERSVVDDVQQCLHDTFVDTTWPACPEHPNHPLWYSDGWWRCNRSGTRVAALGELRQDVGD